MKVILLWLEYGKFEHYSFEVYHFRRHSRDESTFQNVEYAYVLTDRPKIIGKEMKEECA